MCLFGVSSGERKPTVGETFQNVGMKFSVVKRALHGRRKQGVVYSSYFGDKERDGGKPTRGSKEPHIF